MDRLQQLITGGKKKTVTWLLPSTRQHTSVLIKYLCQNKDGRLWKKTSTEKWQVSDVYQLKQTDVGSAEKATTQTQRREKGTGSQRNKVFYNILRDKTNTEGTG